MKLGGKNLKGFRVGVESQESGDSTAEGADDGGLSLPDQMPSENAVPVSGPMPEAGPAPTEPTGELELPDEKSKLEGVYQQVSKTDPNRAAQVLAIKNKIDEPASYIDKNLPEIQKAMAAPSSSFFKQLEDQYPGTTKFLSDPNNMAVAHDDLSNVASHEALIQRVEAYLGTLYGSAKYGAEGSIPGLLYRQAMPDQSLAPKDPDVLQRFAMGASGLAGDLPFMFVGGTAGSLAGATAGAVAGSPGALPGIAAGIAAGGVAGGAVGSFAIPAALKTAIEQKIQNGQITSYSDILKEAAKQGFVGLATLGAGTAAKAAFPATALGAKTVLSTVAPLAAEVGTMTVAGKGVEGKAPTWGDLVDSALQVGAMHGVSHAVEGAFQSNKADAAKDFYTALGNTAEASKLRERMPEAYQELVHNLTVDGPVENVYVPAEAAESYFQSKGIDPTAAMEELGVSKEFQEAKATGGDIKIPLSTWADKIAGTEHYQGLADDVKFSPDDLTVRQVNERKAEIQEQVDKLINERKQAESEKASEAQKQAHIEEASKVFQKIQEQLKAAGLSNPETQFNPQLHEAFFNTLGQHLGVDPAELADRFPLQIGKAEEPTAMPEMSDERMAAQHQDGQTFDQSATERQPAPAFYSKLHQTVEQKMGGSATPEQINGMLKEIKPEERKWSGLDEFLKGKKKVSKEELLNFLRGNQLDIKEVTKGSESPVFKEGFETEQELRDSIQGDPMLVYPATGELKKGLRIGKDSAGKWNLLDSTGEGNDTKYGQYSLPGGENYREMLFTLPQEVKASADDFMGWASKKYGDKFLDFSDEKIKEVKKQYDHEKLLDAEKNSYRSSHWDERNVLAHTRLSDRVDSEGKKVLHIEEIQSDWHQEGRKKGYKGEERELPPSPNLKPELTPEDLHVKETQYQYIVTPSNRNSEFYGKELPVGKGTVESEQAAKEYAARMWNKEIKKANERIETEHRIASLDHRVPDAPFKKTWHEFVLKRLIREAAEKGYDKIAWTPGEAQAERYDLSKKIDGVKITDLKKASGEGYELIAYDHDDNTVLVERLKDLSQVEDYVGKEVAKKLEEKKFEENDFGVDQKEVKGVDLKTGGEGMKGFYDKMIPDFLNKFGKKFDAKVGETKLETAPEINAYGLDVSLKGDGGAAKTFQVHSLDITPKLRDAALNEGFSLFQGAPKLAEATPRGRIRIGREGYAIDLFKNADRSTFLHETGHYFLDVMGHIAADENAPAQVKEDYQTILKWLGVNSREEIGTDEHEKWARGFEQYLMEGKAPSSALTRAFGRFRKWLTSVYQHVKNLNVDLSDDVRGVMDRMLASQDEVEQAKQRVGLTSEEIPGLPADLQAKIQDLQDKARDQAERSLLKEQMAETTAKRKEFLASERERITDEAKKEVSELPLYKAMDEASLDIGRDKRSGEGDDTVSRGARAGTIAEKFLSEKLSPEDTGKFEALAEVHGFASGEELAQHMIMAEEGKLRQREISMRVEAGMSPHADLMKTDAIKAEAMKAIHTEKMTELLALEREALSQLIHKTSVNQEISRRQRIEARVEAQAAKDQAREILSQKSVKDATNAAKYVTAERNAAVKSAKALARKDYEAAAEFKRQQMLNHAIASEAMRNKTEAEKSVSYLTDLAKRKNDLKDMPYGFIRQIDQLLSNSGIAPDRIEDSKTLIAIAKSMLASGESASDIANRTGYIQDAKGAWVPEKISDFVARVNDQYYPLTLPDSVMSGISKAYEDLTLSELRDLKDAAKSIAQIGKKYERFLGEFKTMDMKQAGVELATSIKEKYGTPFADETKAGSAYSSKFQEKIGSLKTLGAFFTRWLDTMYTTCHKLDGLEEGPAKAYIFRPFERAADQKSARTAQAMKEVEKIFSDHYDPKELKEYKEARVRVGDRYFTKENILSMALNFGNEGNKSRLLSGLGLTEDQIQKAFSDHLGKRDWDFAQKTWDHIDQYWPEIAKLEMEVNGVEPKKVQAASFTNQHGSYQGGYYPIAYDYDRSADAFKNAEQRDALYKQFSTAKAATEQGFTESRTKNVERPLRLSLDVLTAHHEDVIHDLEFRKAIIDSSRFLNQKEVKGALVEALGVKGYAGILEWVKAAASDGARQDPLNPWESAAQWLRMKNSVVSMGFKIASAPKIFLENINNVSSELGMTDAARAIGSYLTGSDMHEKVISASEFMKDRANHLDRDMADVMKKVQGEKGPVQWAMQHAFFVHAYMDQAFSFPLWNFVYDKAIEEHGVESKAVSQADEAVRRTFMSSGSVIDQARIMRGSEYQKAMLVAYGYSSMMWNRFSLQAFDAKSQWIQGDRVAATATAAKAFVHTFMVPALVTSLVGALIHNSQSDNPDEEKKKIVTDFLSDATPLSLIPVTRDVVRYGLKKVSGEHTSDLQLLPQEMAIQRLFTPLADVGMAVKTGQMNEKLPEHVANSLSFVAGVPKEMNDVVFNLLDFTKGQGELTYRDALSRRTKH